MAILYGTGFESGNRNGFVQAVNTADVISTDSPHTGNYHLRVNANSRVDLDVNMTLGNVYYVSSWIKSVVNISSIFGFRDTGNNLLSIQVRVSGNGSVELWTANVNRAQYAMTTTDYHHYELYGWEHDTTGSAYVYIDGTLRLSYTGDTKFGSPTTQLGIFLQSSGANVSYFDDVTVANTGLIGDVRYDLLKPDSDSTPEQWALTSGTASYSLVRPTPADDNNYLSTTGTAATILGLDNWDGTNKTPQGIFWFARAWKDYAGTATLSPIISSGATVVTGTAQGLSVATGTYIQKIYETDPNDGAWNNTSINALLIGISSKYP